MKDIPRRMLLFACAFACAAGGVQAQMGLQRSVVAAAGVATRGSALLVQGTVGQTIIGTAAGEKGNLRHGFWYRSAGPGAAVAGSTVRAKGSPGDADAALELSCLPNPVTTSGHVMFNARAGAHVRLVLYDAAGRALGTLYDAAMPAQGPVTYRLDATAIPSGSYTLGLTSNTGHRALQVVIVR